MQDIEPPEVPIDVVSTETVAIQESKKEGFFKKLFSKKESSLQETQGIDLPTNISNTTNTSSDYNTQTLNNTNFLDNNMPSLPPLNEQLNKIINNPSESKDKNLGKSRGKKKKGTQSKMDSVDVKNKFNWSTPIKSQEEIIMDNVKNIDMKVTAKSKGKKKKGENVLLTPFDESGQFDWSREVRQQEILVHDNARYNQDVSVLIKQADTHIENKEQVTSSNTLLSEHQDINPSFDQISIPETHTELNNMMNAELPQSTTLTIPAQQIQENPVQNAQIITDMPIMNSEEHKEFKKISASHQKLRKILEKGLNNKKFLDNKARLKELLKAYDESIEKKIENKEGELSSKHNKLEIWHSQLTLQESGVKKLHTYLKNLDKKLKSREDKINEIISTTVNKELLRRTVAEKKMLKEELNKTSKLNNELKSKVKIIEKDKIVFEHEHKNMMETERKKLSGLQTMYDKKLLELEKDRREFESRRNNALSLLSQADNVSRELDDVKRMKEFIEKNRKVIKKELDEDKELKRAIDRGEITLKREKENLDSLVFSKYLEKKLKGIKPELTDEKGELKIELDNNPLYQQVKQCSVMLTQGNIEGAKQLYNKIKRSFEYSGLPKREREILHTAIRELYNDIQLKIVETEL
jgi:hypothetical protein